MHLLQRAVLSTLSPRLVFRPPFQSKAANSHGGKETYSSLSDLARIETELGAAGAGDSLYSTKLAVKKLSEKDPDWLAQYAFL